MCSRSNFCNYQLSPTTAKAVWCGARQGRPASRVALCAHQGCRRDFQGGCRAGSSGSKPRRRVASIDLPEPGGGGLQYSAHGRRRGSVAAGVGHAMLHGGLDRAVRAQASTTRAAEVGPLGELQLETSNHYVYVAGTGFPDRSPL